MSIRLYIVGEQLPLEFAFGAGQLVPRFPDQQIRGEIFFQQLRNPGNRCLLPRPFRQNSRKG